MNEIMKENLRDLIVEAINQYNPEYVDNCDESELISSLVESVAEFSDEQLEEDPKEVAIREITRQNCSGLSFTN